MWFSGEKLMVGGRLDWMILEVFSNLSDSVILTLGQQFWSRSWGAFVMPLEDAAQPNVL